MELPARLTIRPLRLSDFQDIDEIQRLNPTASQWNAADYLGYFTQVAEVAGRLAGFLAVLELPGGEAEILNVAVHPDFHRQGVASALLKTLTARILYLDVRASNSPALAFYRRHGFVKSGHRRRYYAHPVEDAIMMRRQRGH